MGRFFLSKAKAPNKNGEATDGRSDMDADYTIKENYYKDPTTGETKIKKKIYYGYRYHLLADVNYELPFEYTVTKASKGEKEELIKHIEMIPNKLKEKIKTLCADKGYDSEEVIKFLKANQISPVIDIRKLWRGDKTKQYKDTDIVYDSKGIVMIVNENLEMIPLKYKGYDKIKDTLRYEYKGKIYSIEISYDERIFTPIARDSKKWKRIYNKRTALERINGRIDRDFNLENHKVRGLKKATVLIDIMMIGMMSMAKGHILNHQNEKIRKLKST